MKFKLDFIDPHGFKETQVPKLRKYGFNPRLMREVLPQLHMAKAHADYDLYTVLDPNGESHAVEFEASSLEDLLMLSDDMDDMALLLRNGTEITLVNKYPC